jgi:enamine deaminase RidA (YjgF/YER057c/UK114 family)
LASEQQFVNAFERLKLVLEEAGCQMSDLVELVSYHVGLNSHLAEFAKVKAQYVPAPPSRPGPFSTSRAWLVQA